MADTGKVSRGVLWPCYSDVFYIPKWSSEVCDWTCSLIMSVGDHYHTDGIQSQGPGWDHRGRLFRQSGAGVRKALRSAHWRVRQWKLRRKVVFSCGQPLLDICPTTIHASLLPVSCACECLLGKILLTDIQMPRSKQEFFLDAVTCTCDTWGDDSHLVTIMEGSKGRIFKLKMAKQTDITDLLNLPILRWPYCVTSVILQCSYCLGYLWSCFLLFAPKKLVSVDGLRNALNTHWWVESKDAKDKW